MGGPRTYGKAIARLEQQCMLGGCESKFFSWGRRFIVDVRSTFLHEERLTVEKAVQRNLCGLYCTSKTAAQHGHITIPSPMGETAERMGNKAELMREKIFAKTDKESGNKKAVITVYMAHCNYYLLS